MQLTSEQQVDLWCLLYNLLSQENDEEHFAAMRSLANEDGEMIENPTLSDEALRGAARALAFIRQFDQWPRDLLDTPTNPQRSLESLKSIALPMPEKCG